MKRTSTQREQSGEILTPLEHQTDHLKKLEKCLLKNWFAFDFSALGSGKTFCGAMLSENFDYILVVAPTSVGIKWNQIKEKYNIFQDKEIYIISYAKLRQKPSKWLTYSWSQKSFGISDWFLNILQTKKVLLVCDEIQNIKNDSDQMKSVKIILGYIKDTYLLKGHRFLGISGSPIDKLEQVPRLLGTIHFMTYGLLDYNRSNGYTSFPGLLQCSEKLKYNLRNVNVTRKNHKEIFFKMFLEKFKPKYCFEMEYSDLTNSSVLDIQNGYYNIQDSQELERAKNCITSLNKLVCIRKQTGNSIDIMSQITTVLKNLENEKVKTAVRIIKKEMIHFKKVVLLFNYTNSIETAFEMLSSEFGQEQIAIINGQTPKELRQEIVEKFSEPNEELKLIIGNTKVLSAGIDLDDKHGDFPRFCLVNPNFNIIELYQLTKRFKRANTKSDTKLRFLYCNSLEKEEKILKSLQTKGTIMSMITDEQTKQGEMYIKNLQDDVEDMLRDSKRIKTHECTTDLIPLPCNHSICKDCFIKTFNNGVFTCQECV